MLLGLALFSLAVRGSDGIFSLPEVRDSKIGEFPWMALLMHGAEYKHGATIVSRYYVATVCKRKNFFVDLPKEEFLYSNFRIMGGTISKRFYEFQGAQVRWVYYWENHPKCRLGGETGFASFDISIIKVREHFIFNELLQPMPFMRDQGKMHHQVEEWIRGGNSTCIFGGWGAHKFLHINYTDKPGWPKYTPHQPESLLDNGSPCTECFPQRMKVLEMSLMEDEECVNKSKLPRYLASQIYRRVTPVDTLCAIGIGEDGNRTVMKRTGMPCSRDSGNSLVCYGPEGPVVVGHFSYSNLCNIAWVDFPTIFTRFDWEIHAWLMQFYSTVMSGKHLVDAVYPKSMECCRKYKYSGSINPEL